MIDQVIRAYELGKTPFSVFGYVGPMGEHADYMYMHGEKPMYFEVMNDYARISVTFSVDTRDCPGIYVSKLLAFGVGEKKTAFDKEGEMPTDSPPTHVSLGQISGERSIRT